MTSPKLNKTTTDVYKKLRALFDRDAGVKEVEAKKLSQELGVDYVVLMSAINELRAHKLADYKERDVDEVALTEEGLDYASNGLPERRLLNFLYENEIVEIPVLKFKDRVTMDPKLFFIGLNNMKRNKWVTTSKAVDEETLYLIAKDKKDASATPLEELVKYLGEVGPVNRKDVPGEFQTLLKVLKSRKLVKENKETRRFVSLTKKGMQLDPSTIIVEGGVAQLTPELLKSGKWRDVTFKPFDVTKPGPKLFAGKVHPMVRLINDVREIFLSMGFTEIRGPMIEAAFYNFDALFQPQDHPAREMHDTFYLGRPAKAKLPSKNRVKAVRNVHENGGDTGSLGWGYEWSEEEAKRTLLRTHTTATTVRYLDRVITGNEKLPVKGFSIDRVFRTEKVDQAHLAEFHQIEGIVVDNHVSLTDLIGILTEFYRKMGFEKIITRPGFFPYTEPSMQISVYAEKIGRWLEMGGSGIFRPEVCSPWGIKEPTRVLAWGMGLERLAMLRFSDVKDIRDLYRSPVKWLREVEI
ncbi:MAG: phenylalanine--tRNA ligase subunit alpha [Promethearchaeota archaeon]